MVRDSALTGTESGAPELYGLTRPAKIVLIVLACALGGAALYGVIRIGSLAYDHERALSPIEKARGSWLPAPGWPRGSYSIWFYSSDTIPRRPSEDSLVYALEQQRFNRSLCTVQFVGQQISERVAAAAAGTRSVKLFLEKCEISPAAVEILVRRDGVKEIWCDPEQEELFKTAKERAGSGVKIRVNGPPHPASDW